MPECCGEPTRWVGWRPRTITTRNGVAHLQRPYWHCRKCGSGHWSDRFGSGGVPDGQYSWWLRHCASLLGTVLPFEKAAEAMSRLLGFSMSARQLETWTEETGRAYHARELAHDEPGPQVDTVLVSVDAVMVPFRDGWHEVKVMAAWGVHNGEVLPIEYQAREGSWEEQRATLQAMVRRAGRRLARRVVCVADGAAPIWSLLRSALPGSVEILDWYHAMQHLSAVAKEMPDGEAWIREQKESLRSSGGEATLARLARLSARKGNEGLSQEAGSCLNYLFKHRDRLNYPHARSHGYPIGSGRIESACKQVVQARCKGTGMRWSHGHALAVLNARCAFLNGHWDMVCQQVQKAA